jgi:hypothetical protein
MVEERTSGKIRESGTVRNAVRAGVGSEIIIKRVIFLNNENKVFDRNRTRLRMRSRDERNAKRKASTQRNSSI